MTSSISVLLILSDNFSYFNLFDSNWNIVRIGERDDNYEPGYIASKHTATTSVAFNDDAHGLMHAVEKICRIAIGTIKECRLLDNGMNGEISICYDLFPPSLLPMVVFTESLSALASTNLPVCIRPQIDFWVETRMCDGAMVARSEWVIGTELTHGQQGNSSDAFGADDL